MLEDAPGQFAKSANELKRPLKVSFNGEEGVDEGGVKREFFQMLTPMLLKVDFGMFSYNKDSRNHWFKAGMEGMFLGVSSLENPPFSREESSFSVEESSFFM